MYMYTIKTDEVIHVYMQISLKKIPLFYMWSQCFAID